MIDIDILRNRPDDVKRAVQVKGYDVDVDRIVALDGRRRELTRSSEEKRALRNKLSDQIKNLKADEKNAAIAQVKEIKERMAVEEAELTEIEAELEDLLGKVPQLPAHDAPVGKTSDDNVEVKRVGEPRSFDFPMRDHMDLGRILGLLDKERAVKFAGARSYILRGQGALLELAVMRLALDIVVGRGFTPILGPLMVNTDALYGTGFFTERKKPKAEETYYLERDDKWLIGTSEVHLVAQHADDILDEKELPLLYTGYSPCFRREAGSYGRDTQGLYRVHQFSKVEQVVICKPDADESRRLHAMLLENSERVLQALELPYRVMEVCTGDMGLGKVRMHDIETWMPSRNAYGETHSCSSLHDFQARRMKIRVRDAEGKVQVCHTLNNTAVASPRILIPLLENHQQADGSVRIPKALQPYMGGLEVLLPVA